MPGTWKHAPSPASSVMNGARSRNAGSMLSRYVQPGSVMCESAEMIGVSIARGALSIRLSVVNAMLCSPSGRVRRSIFVNSTVLQRLAPTAR